MSPSPPPAHNAPSSQQAGERASNPEVENENLRPQSGGDGAPRPATEPPGAAPSSRTGKTRTDPGSGEDRTGRNG